MVKKIERNNMPSEIVRQLKGFEDVFEDYVESEEYKELERKENENLKGGTIYELQQFLEQENARLTGLEIFLTKKVPLKINFSQTDKLSIHQLERKKVVKEKLLNELKKPESFLQKNLSHSFDSHFS